MILKKRLIPGLAIYTYLIGDEKTQKAAVIDATRDVQPLIDLADDNDLTITDICETHVHADFLSGALELKHALHNKPTIHCSGEGGEEWTPRYADHIVKDGNSFSLGSLRLQARHTPGHTPEHICWELYDDVRSTKDPWVIFSGDFLFVGSIGRPDLLGEEAQKTLAHQLYRSTFQTLRMFPDYSEVFPGHGAGSLCGKAIGARDSTTVGYEKKYNTSLIEKPENEWISYVMEDMPLAPPYFRVMKQINVEGPKILDGKLPGHIPLSSAEVNEKQKNGAFILDVRSKESFAGTHIPGSLSLPFSSVLSNWAGWLVPYNTPLILVLESPKQFEDVATMLIRVGFDEITGYLSNGINAWESAGFHTDNFSMISEKDFEGLAQKEDLYIVDVRSPEEWKEQPHKGAIHIPLGFLQNHIEKIPQDKPVYTLCRGGYRASIGASVLQKNGICDVHAVIN